MKKLILKTALITLCVALVLLVTAFGLFSYFAPKLMMEFSFSLGLESIGADYAYQEYKRSGELDCLARSFEVTSAGKRYALAVTRFDELTAHPQFESYCTRQDGAAGISAPAYSYRDYVFGTGACMKYHTAKTETEKQEAYTLALGATDKAFKAGNPVTLLILEVTGEQDTNFCKYLYRRLPEGGFTESEVYLRFLKILQDAAGA